MLDIGWYELLLVGALALIVVGPKDLPRMMRTVGQWAGKVRAMAREFQHSLDEAAREADIGEIGEIRQMARDVRATTDLDALRRAGARAIAGPDEEDSETPAAATQGAPAPARGGAEAPEPKAEKTMSGS